MTRTSWRKEAIVSALVANKEQGTTMAHLVETLNLERHTLAKHLAALQKEDLVTSRAVGAAKLWYPQGMTHVSAHAEVTSLASSLLSQITAETPLCFAIADTQLIIRRANEPFKTFYGDVRGRKILRVIARRGTPLREAMTHLFTTGGSIMHETIDCNGVGVHVTATPLHDPKRRLLIIFIEHIDRLRAIRKELAAVTEALESSRQLVCMTDHRSTIEYVNDVFEHATGYSKAELLGKNPRVLKSGVYSKEFYKLLWKTITSKKIFNELFIDRKKNGELYYEEKTITPIVNERGTITHYVSSGRITPHFKH